MRERDIEAALVRAIKSRGGGCRKFRSPSRRNVPDRVCTLPSGIKGLSGLTFFVECKRPGEKPRPGQVREIARMRKEGALVYTVSTLEEVEELVKTFGPIFTIGDIP